MFKGWVISLALLIPNLLVMAQQEGPPTSYYCLSPSGDPIGIVGPVKMWYNQADTSMMASPHTLRDSCVYVTQLCNSRFPEKCHGDCLPGHAVSYTIEPSCVNSTPISPYQSEPQIKHELWFIRGP